jgi:hypothetical protein
MLRKKFAFSAVAFLLGSAMLMAQDQTVTVTSADEAAAQQATISLNAHRALTDAGADASRSQLIQGQDPSSRRGEGRGPVLFPADLSTQPNAPTLATTTINNVFINDPPSAWGDPVGFLTDLNRSRFIHITDQYVGTHANNRYPQGTAFGITITPAGSFPPATHNIITVGQLIAISHAVGAAGGTGLGHVYNLFIPPGTDVCANAANTNCFSPDHPSSFQFCAFHSFIKFPDIGRVIITVLPETGVPGCASQQPSPNGIVADSVDSTMSHELFETFTDPLLNAWFVRDSLDLGGAEIGDVCQPSGNAQGQFLVPTFNVNGHPYAIQLEYSNAGHGCFSKPQDEN